MKITRILALAMALVMAFACTAMAESTFPLVNEPTTLKILARNTTAYPDEDYGKVTGMIKYAEMTGVTIEWENIDSSVFDTTLAARIADGTDMPDVIMKGGINNAKLNSWGDEGILIDLVPYLEEYAPNFYALMKANPALEGTITTPDGKIFGLPQVIMAPVMRVPTKMWLNSKAMAAVGKETPTTTEELYDVLLAIRDSDWNGNGEADEIPLIGTSSNIRNYFLGSFGLRNRGAHAGLVDVDPDTKELRVYATHENFRKFLEYMHRLYADKLLYQEIYTTGFDNATAQAGNQQLSCFFSTTTSAVPSEFVPDWYGVNWPMKGPDGYQMPSEVRGNVHSTGNFCITDSCPEEKIGLALRWVDYFYSEEGSQLALVGVEGQDWEYKADGQPYYTDAALATRTETMNDNTFRAQFGLWPNGKAPAAFFDNLFGAEYDPVPRTVANALMEYATDVIWPNFNWTNEESEVIGTIGTDLETYIDNSTAQIIAGEVELTDEWWNSFVKRINDMGADQLLDVYRQALERTYGEGGAY